MARAKKHKLQRRGDPIERLRSLVADQMAWFARRQFEACGIQVRFDSTYSGREKRLLALQAIGSSTQSKLTAADPPSLEFAAALAIRLPGLWSKLHAQGGNIAPELAAEIADLASLTTGASTLIPKFRAREKELVHTLKTKDKDVRAKLAKEALLKQRENSSKGGSTPRWHVTSFKQVLNEAANELVAGGKRDTPQNIRIALQAVYERTKRNARPPANAVGMGQWKRLPDQKFVFVIHTERPRASAGDGTREVVHLKVALGKDIENLNLNASLKPEYRRLISAAMERLEAASNPKVAPRPLPT